MSYFDTPLVDKAMAEDGWTRFLDNPVYFKKSDNETYPRAIFLSGDYENYHKYFETLATEKLSMPVDIGNKLLSNEDIRRGLHNGGKVWYIHKNIDFLSKLLLLTTDFYKNYCKDGEERYEYYKSVYEKVSGKQYE